MTIKKTHVSTEVCEMAGWDIDKVTSDEYIGLLETYFEEVADFLENAEGYVAKNLAKLDNAGVGDLRKRLAFPEGTVATLPQDDDLVLHVRGLNEAEQAQLVKSLGRRVVGTSKDGLPRIGKNGEVDPESVQSADSFDPVDDLIALTARAVELRQQNPDQVDGHTNLSWRLT